MNKLVFICENTFDGILSAIYDAYYSGMDESLTEVCTMDEHLLEFAADYITTITDPAKAQKVRKAIVEKISANAIKDLYCVYLSCEAGRGEIIHRFLRLAFKMGRKAEGHLTDDWVRKVIDISRRVNRECHRMLGFIRFRDLGGILMAKIKPDNNILELIAPHFADRMPQENWIIYDYARGRACLHERGMGFFIKEDIPEDFKGIICSKDADQAYQDLWKSFFNSIAIRERENLKLQQKNMPKKYWGDIIEMN